MHISAKASHVKESSTLAITAKAKALKAAGAPIISFTAGEPDFDTPKHVNDAAIKAIEEGFTKYTASSGILELRTAICTKLKNDNHLTYAPSQIVVSTGAKQAIYNAFLTILEDGDEVIVPAPYWISYIEVIALCGGVAVPIHTTAENGLKISKAQLESAKTANTKAIIINSPCNPTGVVYNKAELQMIADFANENDLFVLSDEIYEKLIFEDHLDHVSIASLGEDIYNRTIVINGFSKSHAMTGWRMGYSASNQTLATVMGNIQSHTTSNPNSITQKAALAALTGDQQCVFTMRDAFKARRDVIVARILNIPLISAVKPQGAFYVFANVEQLCGTTEINGKMIHNSDDLADALLTECNVALVSGVDFGYDKFIRFSYSMSMESINEGMDRIETFIKKHY